jgi:rubrerythrin
VPFAGESQADRRYIAFARKADQEGFLQIAKLFRAAAKAETVYATNYLNVMGDIIHANLYGRQFRFRKAERTCLALNTRFAAYAETT